MGDARRLHDGTAEVHIVLSHKQIVAALHAVTIDNPNFDPAGWSLYDAEVLEMAGRLVRREIEHKGKGRAGP